MPSLPAPILTVPSAGAQGIPNFCLSYICKALQCWPREEGLAFAVPRGGVPAASLLAGHSGWGQQPRAPAGAGKGFSPSLPSPSQSNKGLRQPWVLQEPSAPYTTQHQGRECHGLGGLSKPLGLS